MTERLRLAELMAALSRATDLGMGQPLEQALRTCLIAIALGEKLGLRSEDLSDAFYVALLRFLGCTADAHDFAAMVGGDDIGVRAAIAPVLGGPSSEFARQVMPRIGLGRGPVRRAQLVASMMISGERRGKEGVRAHCEMGQHLAIRLGLSPGVQRGLTHAFEKWNGTGFPAGTARQDIALSARIVFVARDAEVLHRNGGIDPLRAALRARSGVAYDPDIAATFLESAEELVQATAATSPWDAVLEREPKPYPWVPEARLDSVLETFADFVDMKSPFTAGHSRGVAALASAAAGAEGVPMRRAGLVHDLGRISVPNGIWDKPGPLTDGEWERVRLHAYYTERILTRPVALESMAITAGMHHEKQDGSGYHRGSKHGEIPAAARMLAAADAYQAMTQPRPHRAAFTADAAAGKLESEVSAGHLDAEAVQKVLNAAGHRLRATHRAWPAGLSDREVEVLRLICRGGTKKEVAGRLKISASTVDHHVRHIYEKVGATSRAGATLFAVENELLE